jgi:hypothetical protein
MRSPLNIVNHEFQHYVGACLGAKAVGASLDFGFIGDDKDGSGSYQSSFSVDTPTDKRKQVNSVSALSPAICSCYTAKQFFDLMAGTPESHILAALSPEDVAQVGELDHATKKAAAALFLFHAKAGETLRQGAATDLIAGKIPDEFPQYSLISKELVEFLLDAGDKFMQYANSDEQTQIKTFNCWITNRKVFPNV